ncbi:hypothetical protein [Agathobaculum butyriciproducens]|uniref:hypothetical protein n=1 Tax=Agathobaculum butyriciproducens TaxID=1628085 RepID=UPI0036D39237
MLRPSSGRSWCADLRLGGTMLVGINLLREGLDPEVSLAVILDADSEGFPVGDLAHPDHRPRRTK